jgi:hypothetical protein
VVGGFRFRRRKTAIGIFLIDHFFQPGVVIGGFRAEDYHVGCIRILRSLNT